MQTYQNACRLRRFETQLSNACQFDVANEQSKIAWADIIIIQFPVYWYQVPAGLKRYFDEVLAAGFAYEPTIDYAKGPRLLGKRYLISTTWAAPASAFQQGQFLAHTTLSELMMPLNLTMQFCGLTPITSSPVGFYGVYSGVPATVYQQQITTIVATI